MDFVLGLNRSIFCSLLLFCLGSSEAFANSYLGVNTFEAHRKLAKILASDPQKLSREQEKRAWVRALLASVALDRLEGEDAQAIEKLKKCGDFCGKFETEQEWRAEMAWACLKNKEASLCLPENTKAQKPLR